MCSQFRIRKFAQKVWYLEWSFHSFSALNTRLDFFFTLFSREAPSGSRTLSESKPRDVIRQNKALNGDFLTLAPPTAASLYQHSSNSNLQSLERFTLESVTCQVRTKVHTFMFWCLYLLVSQFWCNSLLALVKSTGSCWRTYYNKLSPKQISSTIHLWILPNCQGTNQPRRNKQTQLPRWSRRKRWSQSEAVEVSHYTWLCFFRENFCSS